MADMLELKQKPKTLWEEPRAQPVKHTPPRTAVGKGADL